MDNIISKEKYGQYIIMSINLSESVFETIIENIKKENFQHFLMNTMNMKK